MSEYRQVCDSYRLTTRWFGSAADLEAYLDAKVEHANPDRLRIRFWCPGCPRCRRETR